MGGNELEPPAGHHSDGGQASQRANVAGPSSKPNVSSAKKRGMFGKLKDKAIGTKEEREAEKQRNAEVLVYCGINCLQRSLQMDV